VRTDDSEPCSDERLKGYRPWLYAAAAYNLSWGGINILFPSLYFDLVGIDQPNYDGVWQVVGMFVLVYAPAYWWAARYPARHRHLVVIGVLGKLFGPIGFVWSVANDDLPAAFGWTIITNDFIWWPAFALYLRDAARLCGGWRALAVGD
jgi:hypothetical protein